MMIAFFCCNICNSCRRQQAEADKFADDSNVSNSPLQYRNSFQNSKTFEDKIALDQTIAEWQQAILVCEDLKKKFVDGSADKEQANELVASIRRSPDDYLNSPDAQIIGIALKCMDIATLQNKLGIMGDMDVRSSQTFHLGRQANLSKASHKDSELHWNEGELRRQATGMSNQGTGGLFTQKLSSVWTMRLNNVNPLQEDFQLGMVDSVMRPKWPKYLHDMCFDVIKVNKYGQQLKRTLKLTQFHVITMKNGTQITKFYRLSDIRRVWLQNGNIIKVIQRNDKKNMYVSPIAPHILQQIITRVQLRHALDHTDFADDPSEAGYTIDSAVAMIKSISEDSAVASEEVFFTFANELKLKVLPLLPTVRTTSSSTRNSLESDAVINALHQSSSSSVTDIGNSLSKSNSGLFVDSESEKEEDEVTRVVRQVMFDMLLTIENGASPPPPPPPTISPSQRASQRMLSTQHALHFEANTPEHLLQTRVREIVSDPSTPEGNTLKLFTQGFLREYSSVKMDDKLLKMRNFIDGMHEHIVINRGYKLAINFQQDKQRSLIFKQAQKSNTLRRKSVHSIKAKAVDNGFDLRDLDDDVLTFISFVVFVVVEETVFLPLKDHILSILKEHKDYHEEEIIIEKTKKFARRSQEAWSIPELLVSPLNWKTAIFELSQLENNLTPTHQLMTLTRTIKAVYNEFKVAILPSLMEKGYKDVFIAADDLVPIFLFIVVHTNLRHPLQNRDLMWALCHPDQLRGEAGYYLTVYESALEFITHETMDAELAGRNSLWMSRSEDHRSRSSTHSTSSSNSTNRHSNILRNVLRLPVASYYDDQQEAMRESFV